MSDEERKDTDAFFNGLFETRHLVGESTLATLGKENQRLKSDSAMLSRIASVVSRYARDPNTTTFDCVVALNNRVLKLNAKIRNHKKAGGRLLK